MEAESSHWSLVPRMTHEDLQEKEDVWRAIRRSKELDEFGFVDHSIIVSIFCFITSLHEITLNRADFACGQ